MIILIVITMMHLYTARFNHSQRAHIDSTKVHSKKREQITSPSRNFLLNQSVIFNLNGIVRMLFFCILYNNYTDVYLFFDFLPVVAPFQSWDSCSSTKNSYVHSQNQTIRLETAIAYKEIDEINDMQEKDKQHCQVTQSIEGLFGCWVIKWNDFLNLSLMPS